MRRLSLGGLGPKLGSLCRRGGGGAPGSLPSLFARHPHWEGIPTGRASPLGGHPHWEGSAVLTCVLGNGAILVGRLMKRALSVSRSTHATPIPSGDGKRVFSVLSRKEEIGSVIS